MQEKIIALASDHAGFDLKQSINTELLVLGWDVLNLGTEGVDSVDYPDFGFKVGQAVASGEYEKGIIICGTGVGISISANKVKGIRAVVCSEPYSAAMSRAHNDANILSMGARVVGTELAKMIVKSFLDTEFEGGRHQKRIDMINNYGF